MQQDLSTSPWFEDTKSKISYPQGKPSYELCSYRGLNIVQTQIPLLYLTQFFVRGLLTQLSLSFIPNGDITRHASLFCQEYIYSCVFLFVLYLYYIYACLIDILYTLCISQSCQDSNAIVALTHKRYCQVWYSVKYVDYKGYLYFYAKGLRRLLYQ